jgi:type I restriction enzyme M protein
MSEDQKRKLESKLWAIANDLRGKMDADDFRDYILGFIFFKYLSERMYLFANDILEKTEFLTKVLTKIQKKEKSTLALSKSKRLTNSVIS